MNIYYKLWRRCLNLGFVCAVSVAITSCDDTLDLKPETDISDVDYWKTADDLKQAANYFYLSLPPMEANDNANASDDGFGRARNTTSDGTRTRPETDNTWNDGYRYIRACNNLIEKSARVNDRAAVALYKAEARFFRAFTYFELVRKFGDVPLILRTFDIDDPLLKPNRVNREVVLDTVYADLDFAIANLPNADKVSEYGRVTSGAALALKAKVGLFEGTWNKYHSAGDPNKHLNIAVNASESLMQSGLYSLYRYDPKPDSSYYFLFQYAGEGRANKENILVRLYGQNQQNVIQSHQFVRSYLETAGVTPTRALVDAYLYTDGLPPEKSTLKQTPTNSLSEFQNRDPRLGMTVFNRNSWFLTSFYVPNFLFSNTGYLARKYFIVRDWEPNRSFVDNIVIRYAEVLLINAEAKYELNNAITDQDLDRTINLLRKRVNMPSLTNAFVTANGLNMLDEIRRERRIELALEWNHRYYDLLRWKTAEVELPKAVLGRQLFPAEFPNVNRNLDANGYVITQAAATRRFDPSKDYLSPIGTTEIARNENLKQNPNWTQ